MLYIEDSEGKFIVEFKGLEIDDDAMNDDGEECFNVCIYYEDTIDDNRNCIAESYSTLERAMVIKENIKSCLIMGSTIYTMPKE